MLTSWKASAPAPVLFTLVRYAYEVPPFETVKLAVPPRVLERVLLVRKSPLAVVIDISTVCADFRVNETDTVFDLNELAEKLLTTLGSRMVSWTEALAPGWTGAASSFEQLVAPRDAMAAKARKRNTFMDVTKTLVGKKGNVTGPKGGRAASSVGWQRPAGASPKTVAKLRQPWPTYCRQGPGFMRTALRFYADSFLPAADNE